MTTYLADILDVDLLNEMLETKMVRAQTLTDMDINGRVSQLAILNYAPECVYSNTWNDVTRKCRGLIYNCDTLEVLARPFEKFWSAGQLVDRPELGVIPASSNFRIFDKVDGSLGIGYTRPDGKYAIATRGSFSSEQAVHATALWQNRHGNWEARTDATPMFEIVYPENRIVLDYGEADELVYLGSIEIATGKFLPPNPTSAIFFKQVEEYTAMEAERENKEGYVLWYPEENFRVKVKHEEYVRLHAIVTMANTKTIWRALKDGTELELLDLPDEFSGPVKQLVERFKSEYRLLEIDAKMTLQIVNNLDELEGLPHTGTRKEQAHYLKTHCTRIITAIVFKMIDGKDYSETIWNHLEPKQAESIFGFDEGER